MTRRIEKLLPHHAVEAFDCGHEVLNRFLQKHAVQNQFSGGSQTYVGLVDNIVVGYYALAVGSVEQENAPERVKKGLAKHSIPIMLLARLAVDLHWQKQGVGAALLKDATLRTLQAMKRSTEDSLSQLKKLINDSLCRLDGLRRERAANN